MSRVTGELGRPVDESVARRAVDAVTSCRRTPVRRSCTPDVVTAPTSWLGLFDPQWAGRASMEDISVTAIDWSWRTGSGCADMDSVDRSGKNYHHHRDQFRTF
jgi:hypothetical protein